MGNSNYDDNYLGSYNADELLDKLSRCNADKNISLEIAYKKRRIQISKANAKIQESFVVLFFKEEEKEKFSFSKYIGSKTYVKGYESKDVIRAFAKWKQQSERFEIKCLKEKNKEIYIINTI